MINYDAVKESVVGRWPGIFINLGIEVGDGKHTSCPVCGGKDRFRFDNKEGKGTWFCNNCGAGDGWSLLMQKLGLSFKEALEEVGTIVGAVQKTDIKKEPVVTPDIMRKVFNGSSPVSNGDPVSIYLNSRGLNILPEQIRYHPKCWESETSSNQKAMLAIFHNKTGKAITMHRTYLDDDGEKLDLESCKKVMPALEPMSGGAARLFPLDDSGFLGVAEGIETAIAAHLDSKIPVWSCLSATLLESFVPPEGIKQLFIFSDNDKNYAGQKSAYVLANRLSVTKGIPVTVYVPDRTGEDWADLYLRTRKRQ